ncbi:MAG TPA: hypothetical protein VLL52_15465 [Anaerolineae bacterium]|nr:hypothetical protein [Anaerolineae bacterium]
MLHAFTTHRAADIEDEEGVGRGSLLIQIGEEELVDDINAARKGKFDVIRELDLILIGKLLKMGAIIGPESVFDG